MKTLHIAPGGSAGGSLKRAIQDAGQDDGVLSCPDDLSCGPIASDNCSERAKWWAPFYGDHDIEGDLNAFWDRVATTDDRLVVWFGRYRASELAFFLAWADRLGDRPYDIVDVTGRQFLAKRRDGSSAMSRPVQSVGIINSDGLRSLLGSEQPVTAEIRDESSRTWRQLKAENAPFRVVSPSGLASAPADCFDPLILERATPEWQLVARIVGETMGYNCEPYMQVGDVMLRMRLVALVEEGKLLADGDPREMRSCRVRLPD
jgi:hypothetical protein